MAAKQVGSQASRRVTRIFKLVQTYFITAVILYLRLQWVKDHPSYLTYNELVLQGGCLDLTMLLRNDALQYG